MSSLSFSPPVACERQTFLLAKRSSAAMSEEKCLPFAGYAPRVSWGPEHEDHEDLVFVLRPPGDSGDENDSLFATLILCAFRKQLFVVMFYKEILTMDSLFEL